MHCISVAGIIAAALAVGSPFKTVAAQPDSVMWAGCRSFVLAEQLHDHCLIPDRLAKVIPGFADLASDTPPSCAWTVFLTNPARDGARAKRILAPLLPESLKDRQECAPGGIRVRPSRYNMAQLVRVSNRMDSLIDAFGYHRFPVPRTLAFVDSGSVVVTAHNQRALDHLRAAIRNDPAFRPYPIVLRLSEGPQELDPPIHPPRAAALLVLDSLASRFAGQRIAFDTKKLPPGVTVADLISRHLRPIGPGDT